MAVNGVAVGVVAAGGLLVYSGITGRGLLASTQSIIQGKSPAGVGQANPITGNVGAGAAAIGASAAGIAGAVGAAGAAVGAAAIASRAKGYEGAGYVWAGAPALGIGHWDCSSFVNWVIGHDLGLPIPLYKAGTYTGHQHGPTAAMWLAWSGAVTVGHKGADALPGDLCVWQTHIGIALGGGLMISARSQHSHPPTGINKIDGDIPGEILFVRRLKVA